MAIYSDQEETTFFSAYFSCFGNRDLTLLRKKFDVESQYIFDRILLLGQKWEFGCLLFIFLPHKPKVLIRITPLFFELVVEVVAGNLDSGRLSSVQRLPSRNSFKLIEQTKSSRSICIDKEIIYMQMRASYKKHFEVKSTLHTCRRRYVLSCDF